MALLTAEFPPSSGDAKLASFSVKNEPELTRRKIGYCPQFDAHFANMTGEKFNAMPELSSPTLLTYLFCVAKDGSMLNCMLL